MFHGSTLVLEFHLTVSQSTDPLMTPFVGRLFHVTTRWNDVCPYLYDHPPTDIYASIPSLNNLRTQFNIEHILINWEVFLEDVPRFHVEDRGKGPISIAAIGEHIMTTMTLKPPSFSLMRPHRVLQ